MLVCDERRSAPATSADLSAQPIIVVGVTHSQTCLVLTGHLRALRDAGFRVILISSPGPLLDQTAEEEGVEAVTIAMTRRISPLSDLISLFHLWRVLRRLRPVITEFSTPKAGLLGNLAAMLCRVPARVYVLRGLRLETASGIKRQVLRATEHIAAACAQHVLCTSESLRVQAIALGIASSHKLQLLGNGSSHGVDVDRFSPGPSAMKASLGLPRHAPVVGFVGRLTRDKGVPELIAAFDDLLQTDPEVRLLMVGWFDQSEDAVDDDLRDYIVAHPKIVLTGFVADTAPYYRVMDLMVLPTWREGFPNVVLEAAATGIPVITTLATGSRDAVLPEVTGLLIPPGYPEAIAEAMRKLLGDPVRRNRMGVAARQWVTQRFSDDRVIGWSVLMYKSLLKAPIAKALLAIIKTKAAHGVVEG